MTTMQENYGFERTPFSKDIPFKDLFRYSQLEDLFVRVRATVEDGSGLLVTGRAGTGKTTTIRGYLDSLGSKYRVIYLGQYQFGNALFARLGLEFGLRSNMWAKKRMVGLVQKISEESSGGRRLILVIDEAQLLDQQTFEDIRLLTNADMDRRSPMSLIMIGQRWLRNMLISEEQEALHQRLRLRYALEGLSEAQTKEYIQHHLQLVGCAKQLFTTTATKAIFVASEGIPREINNICYESLLVATHKQAQRVDDKVVNWVIDQRDLS
jgi:type II secretory pathway predicted ATPase ExeA